MIKAVGVSLAILVCLVFDLRVQAQRVECGAECRSVYDVPLTSASRESFQVGERPCGGAAPDPPRMIDGAGVSSTEGRAWAEAMENWRPCQEQHKGPAAVSAKGLAHQPPNAARKEYALGLQAWRKKQNVQAAAHFSAAIHLDSGYVLPYVILGAIQVSAGQLDQAAEGFARVVALEPNQSSFQFQLAWTLLQLDRGAEAEPHARRALQLQPSYLRAAYALGMAQVQQEHYSAETVRVLQTAPEKFPEVRPVLEFVEQQLSQANSSAR